MYRGIIELEPLTNASIMREIRVVEEREERHPEANTKLWHIYKVKVPGSRMKPVAQKISRVIKPDWYSLFWDKSSVYAVFSNKIFILSRRQVEAGDYSEAKKYGIRQGIQEEFMNLQRTIEQW